MLFLSVAFDILSLPIIPLIRARHKEGRRLVHQPMFAENRAWGLPVDHIDPAELPDVMTTAVSRFGQGCARVYTPETMNRSAGQPVLVSYSAHATRQCVQQLLRQPLPLTNIIDVAPQV
jgi:hypothetical protein